MNGAHAWLDRSCCSGSHGDIQKIGTGGVRIEHFLLAVHDLVVNLSNPRIDDEATHDLKPCLKMHIIKTECCDYNTDSIREVYIQIKLIT